MSIGEIGCCGAYCKTCKEYQKQLCKGCKIGYSDGKRDINRAKCKIKVCCLSRQYNSCADCPEYFTCEILSVFHAKNNYKYRKYKQATDYIREHGYEKFLKIAEKWTHASGKY